MAAGGGRGARGQYVFPAFVVTEIVDDLNCTAFDGRMTSIFAGVKEIMTPLLAAGPQCVAVLQVHPYGVASVLAMDSSSRAQPSQQPRASLLN